VGSGVREGVGEGLVRMGGGVLKGTETNPGDRELTNHVPKIW
jgi:hypothetical protein